MHQWVNIKLKWVKHLFLHFCLMFQLFFSHLRNYGWFWIELKCNGTFPTLNVRMNAVNRLFCCSVGRWKQSMWTHFTCCVNLIWHSDFRVCWSRAWMHCLKEQNCASHGDIRLVSAAFSWKGLLGSLVLQYQRLLIK